MVDFAQVNTAQCQCTDKCTRICRGYTAGYGLRPLSGDEKSVSWREAKEIYCKESTRLAVISFQTKVYVSNNVPGQEKEREYGERIQRRREGFV